MWPNSDRITFQALPLAWAVECWELACRGKGVAGPAEPQSGPLEMRSGIDLVSILYLFWGHINTVTGLLYTSAANLFNNLQFPVSQVQQLLIVLPLALKYLQFQYTTTCNTLQQSA